MACLVQVAAQAAECISLADLPALHVEANRRAIKGTSQPPPFQKASSLSIATVAAPPTEIRNARPSAGCESKKVTPPLQLTLSFAVTRAVLQVLREEHPGVVDASATPIAIAQWHAAQQAARRMELRRHAPARDRQIGVAEGESPLWVPSEAWESAMSASLTSAASSPSPSSPFTSACASGGPASPGLLPAQPLTVSVGKRWTDPGVLHDKGSRSEGTVHSDLQQDTPFASTVLGSGFAASCPRPIVVPLVPVGERSLQPQSLHSTFSNLASFQSCELATAVPRALHVSTELYATSVAPPAVRLRGSVPSANFDSTAVTAQESVGSTLPALGAGEEMATLRSSQTSCDAQHHTAHTTLSTMSPQTSPMHTSFMSMPASLEYSVTAQASLPSPGTSGMESWDESESGPAGACSALVPPHSTTWSGVSTSVNRPGMLLGSPEEWPKRHTREPAGVVQGRRERGLPAKKPCTPLKSGSDARSSGHGGGTSIPPQRAPFVAFVAEVHALMVDANPQSGHMHASITNIEVRAAEQGHTFSQKAGVEQFEVVGDSMPARVEVPVVGPSLVVRGSPEEQELSSASSMPCGPAADAEEGIEGFGRKAGAQQLRPSASLSHLVPHLPPARSLLSHQLRLSMQGERGNAIKGDQKLPLLAATATLEHVRAVLQPVQVRLSPAMVDCVLMFLRSIKVAVAAAEQEVAMESSRLPAGVARVKFAAEAYLGAPRGQSMHMTVEGVAVCIDIEADGSVEELWLEVKDASIKKERGAGSEVVAAAADDLCIVQDRTRGGWVSGGGPATTLRGNSSAVPLAAQRWHVLPMLHETSPDSGNCLRNLLSNNIAIRFAMLRLTTRPQGSCMSGGRGGHERRSMDCRMGWQKCRRPPYIEAATVRAVLRLPAAAFAPLATEVHAARLQAHASASDKAKADAILARLQTLAVEAAVPPEAVSSPSPPSTNPTEVVMVHPKVRLLVVCLQAEYANADVDVVPTLRASLQQVCVDVQPKLSVPQTFGEMQPRQRDFREAQMSVVLDASAMDFSMSDVPEAIAPAVLVFLPSNLRRIAANALTARMSMRLTNMALTTLTVDIHSLSADGLCYVPRALLSPLAAESGCCEASLHVNGEASHLSQRRGLWRMVHDAAPDTPGLIRVHLDAADAEATFLHTTILCQDMTWAASVVSHICAATAGALLPPSSAEPSHGGSQPTTPAQPHDPPVDPFRATTIALKRCTIVATAPHASVNAAQAITTLYTPLVSRLMQAVSSSDTSPVSQPHLFHAPPPIDTYNSLAVPAVELAFDDVTLIIPDMALLEVLSNPSTLNRVLSRSLQAAELSAAQGTGMRKPRGGAPFASSL
jgi:hypothetical protein